MGLVTAHITISQGADPSSFTVLDDSINEGDETYTDRYLTILDSADEPLPDYPNPIDFNFDDFPDNEITIEGLTQDMALSVTMTLVPTSPVGGSTYTVTEDIATNRYLQQGVYNIQQARFLDNDLPGLAGVDAQYNSINIIIEQQNSQTAVLYGSLVSAQNALNRGQNIINSQVI